MKNVLNKSLQIQECKGGRLLCKTKRLKFVLKFVDSNFMLSSHSKSGSVFEVLFQQIFHI